MVESDDDNDEIIPIISDVNELLRCGVVSRVSILTDEVDVATWQEWAAVLSTVTPENMAAEGDGEYAYYRNILEEADFPFDSILQGPVGEAIRKYFNVQSLSEEIKLDDAFCIHYNTSQKDTRGAKHIDPSDITVNMCLTKSHHCVGSHVMFYGTKPLYGVGDVEQQQQRNSNAHDNSKVFLVHPEAGYATLHWGNHPHETTALKQGQRTNIVLTYCYTDPSRSDVATRACYNV